MIPISNTELAGTQRNMEKGTVNDMTTFRDFQGNEGHFIGYWLNIVYFSNTPRKLFRFPNEPFVHARFIQLQFSVLFYFKLPSHSISAPYAPWQWHITL